MTDTAYSVYHKYYMMVPCNSCGMMFISDLHISDENVNSKNKGREREKEKE